MQAILTTSWFLGVLERKIHALEEHLEEAEAARRSLSSKVEVRIAKLARLGHCTRPFHELCVCLPA